jgi:hypothetical protein
MTHRFQRLLAALVLLGAACACAAQQTATYHLGFDRNVYPGDGLLTALRQSFQFTGYWLNNPPGETTNSWAGKRAILKQNGFGFLVLFRGRNDAELKSKDAAALGREDAKAAVAAAAREGFAPNVLIFLDQEEGGRLLPEQADYLFAWVDAVRAGGARAGVYCSSIQIPDGPDGKTISTAQDIVKRETAMAMSSVIGSGGEREPLALWLANDGCPPSPGCTIGEQPIWAEYSPYSNVYAVAWQYAQSPRRAQFSAACPQNQASDGMCYAPGVPHSANMFVDLDTAQSPDPSEAP